MDETADVEKIHKMFLDFHPVLLERIRTDTETMQCAIQHVEKNRGRNDTIFTIFNAFPFFRLSCQDIVILYKSFISTNDNLEKQTFAKILMVSMYEFLEDVPQIFGKEFKKALTFFKTEKALEELKKIMIGFHKIKNTFVEELKLVRNNTFGHKEHNSLLQTDIVNKLNYEVIEWMWISVLHFLSSMMTFEKTVFAAVQGKVKQF